ncbi:MAG: DNA repair protein RecN [Chloroflexota bacterium]|nr:DNA repair protein RecN [Chloroflexota bacterium]
MTAERDRAMGDPARPPASPPGRLLELTVMDLALLDRSRIAFDAGLNVLTGETGAGKSLLIDALGLALGARADSTLVRHGTEVARVEALFDRLPEPLIVVREVSTSGRSVARLDDQAVTASRLFEEVGALVEIHGQHEQSRLLEERRQRDLLDAYGGLEPMRIAVTDAVERWRENRALLDAATLDPREVARRLALLEHEAAEIGAADLRPGEADAITGRLTAAMHGEAIARGAAALRDALTAEGGGARDVTAAALREARGLARLDPRFEAIAERLAGLEAELDDVAVETRRLADGIDHDPRALADLDQRLGIIHGLLRRYGDDEAAVVAHGEAASAEAERLRGLDQERAHRQEEDARRLAEIAEAAGALSVARRASASQLSRAVGSVLEELGFPADVFDIAVGRRTADAGEPAVEVDGDALAFDATGIDRVVYRLAPNPGEPARPLARIASGGELSRIALAIKRVLAEADETPTLIFDEVDTGIGGRSADPIGRSLWGLARRHQVLCVTHLPQIAAHADAHFRISKRELDGRTVTRVDRLDREGRIVELAAMLGGGPGEQAALASARQLLDRAETWRAEPVAILGPD